jgi:hypothetical protein
MQPSVIDDSIRGPGALDAAAAEVVPSRRTSGEPRRRSWSPGARGQVALIALGVSLGPHALAVLTPRVLSLIDPIVPVALATVGVLAAFEVDASFRRATRTGAAAGFQVVLAGGLVTVGLHAAAVASGGAVAGRSWTLALIIGVCAAMSATLAWSRTTPGTPEASAPGLDALFPIVVGAVIVALADSSVATALWLLLGTAVVILLVAVAGWLLLTTATAGTEQRVFVIAALLLVGGLADHGDASPLLAGVIAGALWRWLDGPPRESIGRDITYLQHSLLALLLLVAGARVMLSPFILSTAILYVVLRVAAAIAARRIAAGLVALRAADTLDTALLHPGILGIAFALNASRAAAGDATVIISVAVLGTIGAHFLVPRTPGTTE